MQELQLTPPRALRLVKFLMPRIDVSRITTSRALWRVERESPLVSYPNLDPCIRLRKLMHLPKPNLDTCLSIAMCVYQISIYSVRNYFQVYPCTPVAVAWSVEYLPSNPAARVRFPAGLGILISVLGLGCVLCLCLRRRPWHCTDHTFREARLCVSV